MTIDGETESTLFDCIDQRIQQTVCQSLQLVENSKTVSGVFGDDDRLIGPFEGISFSRERLEVLRRSHKEGEDLGEEIRRKGDDAGLFVEEDKSEIMKGGEKIRFVGHFAQRAFDLSELSGGGCWFGKVGLEISKRGFVLDGEITKG